MRDYIAVGIVLALPFLAILVILLTEPGLSWALLRDGVINGIILIVLGGGLAFTVKHFLVKEEAE